MTDQGDALVALIKTLSRDLEAADTHDGRAFADEVEGLARRLDGLMPAGFRLEWRAKFWRLIEGRDDLVGAITERPSMLGPRLRVRLRDWSE